MQRAAIYLRISQDREGTELGVERQERECRQLAERHGLTVVEVYTDNDTGASTRSRKARPHYDRMLADLDAGRFTVVVAYSMSRLTRRPREAEGLLERAEAGRLTLRTVASGDPDLTRADGRAMFRTLVAFDVAEAERISERVTAAAKQRAERGRNMGGPRRFGYTLDGRDLVPEEADALRWTYRHILAGGSLRSAVAEWHRRGLTGPTGATITSLQVRSALLRPQNGGLATYKGQIVGRSDLPAIVDEDTFRTAVEILNDPARHTRRGRPARGMLSGVLFCAVCKGKCYTRNRSGRQAGRAVYACHGAQHVQRSRDKLDGLLGDLVVGYLQKNRKALRKPIPGPTGNAEEVARLRDRLARLQRLFNAEQIDPEDFAATAGPLRGALQEAEARAVAQSPRPATAALVASEDIAAAWGALDTDGRRVIVRELIERIEVDRTGPAGKFTPAGITVRWKEDAA